MDIVKLNTLKRKNLLNEIIYFRELSSTNKYAKDYNPENDTLIITSNQLKGRGRFERVWETESGENITITLVKSFKLQTQDVHLINFYTSLIICDVFKNILSDRQRFFISLKWPNDILLNGKKISGILTELIEVNSNPKKFIIGIGVNINQEKFSDELYEKATSLKISTGVNFNIEEIIIQIIEEFYDNLDLIRDKDKLINLWKANTDVIDRDIKFIQNDTNKYLIGKIIDIQNDGGIKIEVLNESNTKKIAVYYSGEINFI